MKLNAQGLEKIVNPTLEHYNQHAEEFWAGTCDHDVSQNRSAIGGHSRNSFDHFVGDGAQAGRYCVDCGFDSARLGATTVIAHIVRRPDNRFNYLEVSGVPVHPASQSRSRQRYWFLDCPDLSLGEVCRLLRLRGAFTSSMDFV